MLGPEPVARSDNAMRMRKKMVIGNLSTNVSIYGKVTCNVMQISRDVAGEVGQSPTTPCAPPRTRQRPRCLCTSSHENKDEKETQRNAYCKSNRSKIKIRTMRSHLVKCRLKREKRKKRYKHHRRTQPRAYRALLRLARRGS
jgi:hypothetical protein